MRTKRASGTCGAGILFSRDFLSESSSVRRAEASTILNGMEKQQVWSESYKVASFMVNLRGRAGLYSILNFVQDVGWLHAMHVKIDTPKGHGWVFTRQKLMMTVWPAWNETVTIRTWLRPPGAEPFYYRDYEIYLRDQKIGECTSTFSVMSMETRKIVAMDFSKYDTVWRRDGLLAHLPEKIQIDGPLEELAQFQVRNSDIDLNNHVNNTKYAQWLLDALPIADLREGLTLHEYAVNFLAETKTGDIVTIHRTPEQLTGDNEALIKFQGIRAKDGKPAFLAQMRVSRTVPQK